MKFLLLVLSFCFTSETFAQKNVSFSQDIFPLVKKHCIKCHEKDDENPNNFSMDNVPLMRTSGKTKNIIIPGDGKNSYIIKKLLPNPPKGAQMPIFSKKKLSKEEVNLFIRWIDEGAKDN